MTFKSRTPREEECIMPMRCITLNKDMKDKIESNKYKFCNHHHELTKDHEVIDIDGSNIVVNKEVKLKVESLVKMIRK